MVLASCHSVSGSASANGAKSSCSTTRLGPFIYEHNLRNPRTGKYDIYEACPKEWENCPVCAGEGTGDRADGWGRDSGYIMFLTAMDLTPYTKKDGTVVNFSRKLLPVKAAQQGFYLRQFDKYGSLRGLQLLMTRDTKDSPQIGNAEYIERHSEQEILASFGHPPVLVRWQAG